MRVTDHTYVLSGTNYSAGEYGPLGNVYGIQTNEGLILIDCGLPDSGLEIIQETLDYYGITDPVTHVLVTHAHVDHCGNAKYYQDRGAKIIVGAGDVDYLCKAGGFNMFRDTRVEETTYHLFPAFTPDIAIDHDQEMEIHGLAFQFILIPGHSMGSMAIQVTFEGKTMLFVGDVIRPAGIFCEDIIPEWRGDPKFDRQMFVESMVKLAQLDTDMVLPGHGTLVVRDGTKVLRIAAKKAYTTMR